MTPEACSNCGRLVSGGTEGVGALCICDEECLRGALAQRTREAASLRGALQFAVDHEPLEDYNVNGEFLAMAAAVGVRKKGAP